MTSDYTIEQILEGCRAENPKMQKMLYDRYSPVLLGLALRYLKDQQHAEDAMVEGMYKAFKNIHKYSGKGSLEGWLKKIVVNECLMHLRKKVNKVHHTEISEHHVHVNQDALDQLQEEDILNLLTRLPDGYRTVFNMYVIEGYKHKEIAEQLNISESTSKSQLFLAKKKLQKWIVNQ